MFNRIEAENLFSWEKLDYEVRPGISQITGFNFDDNTSEGSGKSSIPNILCWVLYGKVPKDVKVDEVIRDGETSAVGKVTLSDGTAIYRQRRPNVVEILENDGTITKGKDATETQKLINKLIGLDFEAFCQCIYFAQNYPKKFVSSNETDKALILSEIQDLTVYDRARKKITTELKLLEPQIINIEKAMIHVRADISKNNAIAETVVKAIDLFEANKSEALEKLLTQREALDGTIRNIESALNKSSTEKELLQEIAKTEEMLRHLNSKKIEIASEIRLSETKKRELASKQLEFKRVTKALDNIALKLSKFESSAKDCPLCGEPVAKHKLDHVFQEKKAMEVELDELLEDRNMIIAEMGSLKDIPDVEECRKLQKDIDKEYEVLTRIVKNLQGEGYQRQAQNTSLANYTREYLRVTTEIEATMNKSCDKEWESLKKIEAALDELKVKEVTLKSQIDVIQNKINDLELLKSGFKEIKSYVFQSLLNELSVKATEFATDLFELPVLINFSNEGDESSVTKIQTQVTLDGNTRSLGLFSGGQYRRIELAVDLALAQIVGQRSQRPINFRIFDEPMKDLSESSQEKVVELLKKLKGSTIIIEHNSITKSIIHSVFDVEYRNGISYAPKALEM